MTRDKAYKITKIVVIAAVAVIIVWDLYAQLAHGLTATVSYAIWEFCEYAPFVPFICGALASHLFWPGGRPEKRILEVPHQVVYGTGRSCWTTLKTDSDTHKAILSNVEEL
jgi:hypothetical protein